MTENTLYYKAQKIKLMMLLLIKAKWKMILCDGNGILLLSPE